MIGKLKKRFVCINMLFVLIILTGVFAVMITSTETKLKNECYGEMEQRASSDGQFGQKPFSFIEKPGKDGMLSGNISLITVKVNGDGILSYSVPSNISIDYSSLEETVLAIRAETEEKGELKQYNIRYIKKASPTETLIVIADLSNEKMILRNLVASSLVVGIGAFGAFFFISILLAGIAVAPIKKSWEAQKQFLFDASHELKTPLTVILANTKIICSHPDESVASNAQWLKSTVDEGESMKELISNMLFLAKNDEDEPLQISENIPLSEIVCSAALPFEAVAFEKELVFSVEAEENITFYGNKQMIFQLVTILTDNACKYAQKKESVSISLTQHTGKAVLTVKNTGTSIDEKDRENIFKRFYRTDSSRSRENGGSGLGLAIAKNICDRHKAKISVSGTNETIFTVVFHGRK